MCWRLYEKDELRMARGNELKKSEGQIRGANWQASGNETESLKESSAAAIVTHQAAKPSTVLHIIK